MNINEIEGATRTLGAEQGYIPLPVRDTVLHDAASGMMAPAMQTSWTPTKEEISRMRAGAPIRLTVLGTAHPPVIMEVDPYPIIVIDHEDFS